MIRYAILMEDNKFLESDQFVDSETGESPLVEDIEDAVLYESLEAASEINEYKMADGYNSDVVKVEISFSVKK